MQSFRDDLRFGLRILARRPRFSLLLIATIALGIGSATSMFSLVDGVLLKPLPYRDQDRLVSVWRTSQFWRHSPVLSRSSLKWDALPVALPDYFDWAASQRSFEATAAWVSGTGVLTGPGGAEEVRVGRATASLMPLLGVRPALGRWFLPGDDGVGAARLIVLSFEAWRTRFGGDSSVVGRSLTLRGEPHLVVGVLPETFRMAGEPEPSEVWTAAGSASYDLERNNWNYNALGLLKPGVSPETAVAEAAQTLATGSREANDTVAIRLSDLKLDTTRAVRAPLLLLLWASVLLLVIASANVATLLLGEAGGRDGEIAARIALGASRHRLVRQLLTENAILAGLGAAVGILVAMLAVRVLTALAPQGIPRLEFARVDGRAAAVALVVTGFTAMLFSLAPIMALARTSPAAILQAGSTRLSRQRGAVQRFGVLAQCALVVVLLVGAALLVRTHQRLRAVDPGFAGSEILSVRLNPPSAAYGNAAARRQFFTQVAERVSGVPGVRAVAVASGVPFQGSRSSTTIEAAESRAVPPGEQTDAAWRVASPGFFETAGIPLRVGRLFGREDAGPGDAVIVNEAMARRFWPDRPALGMKIRVDKTWLTIVGVVGDVRHSSLDEEPTATFYLPLAQTDRWSDAVVVRFSGDPAALTGPIRGVVRGIDPSVVVSRIDRLSDRIELTLVAERFRMILITFFAIAAALLAAVGVYGVATGTVVRRLRELGIRMAVGATPHGILRLVMGGILGVAGAGVLAGAAAAAAATRLVKPFLYGVSPVDPVSFGLVGGLVFLVALGAAWAPALRASRIQPMRVLRGE
ncbi:MAG: ABC transporter permease [Gemmatimonadales bacterium]|nr:ABC transporter permease [Gemmatimonadales bacterium]